MVSAFDVFDLPRPRQLALAEVLQSIGHWPDDAEEAIALFSKLPPETQEAIYRAHFTDSQPS